MHFSQASYIWCLQTLHVQTGISDSDLLEDDLFRVSPEDHPQILLEGFELLHVVPFVAKMTGQPGVLYVSPLSPSGVFLTSRFISDHDERAGFSIRAKFAPLIYRLTIRFQVF